MTTNQTTVGLTSKPKRKAESVASYSIWRDNLAKRASAGLWGSELRDLNRIIQAKAVAERLPLPAKQSWTSKLLATGLHAVIKKVNEEAAELVLAACSECDRSVVMEAADLVYHVVVFLKATGLQMESVVRIIQHETNYLGRINSLAVLEQLALAHYNRIAFQRNSALARGRKVESVIRIIVDNLYFNVCRLTFLSARAGVSTYVNAFSLESSVYKIFLNLMMVLCYRGISYQSVINELYSRMYPKLPK
ncbi:MAG: phosphoribosyl-ATP diphosphatase [Candidatus Hodgkinia cicadicola]|nr:MAG: phosphoribosyl-ATP diphosphatase [Candidatus Hodgkinia cicadicola]